MARAIPYFFTVHMHRWSADAGEALANCDAFGAGEAGSVMFESC